jgi:hypothetical protein
MTRRQDKPNEFVWLIACLIFSNVSLFTKIRMQTRDTRIVYANILGDGEDVGGKS